MNKNMFTFTLFAFTTTLSFAQKSAQVVQGGDRYSIPFYVTSYNNVVVKVVLNNQDTVNLMLHTASSDVTITEEALQKLHAVKFNSSVDSVKSWGGNNNVSEFSKNNLIKIANESWDSITIWKDKNSGQETDGKFGLNFFENKVIALDFDKNLLTVQTQLPSDIKAYQKFPLQLTNHEMFIQGVCQTKGISFANHFLIHSGYGGSILLDNDFVNKSAINKQIQITSEKKLTDAYGNILVTKKGLLPKFIIGGMQLKNVPVGFFEGAIGNQKLSVIGGDILKRFNWIIDAKREWIYLKQNKHFNTNFSTI